MPTYAYKCEKCSQVTEILCCFSEKRESEKKLVCESCGHKTLIPVFKMNIMSESCSCNGSCGSCNNCS